MPAGSIARLCLLGYITSVFFLALFVCGCICVSRNFSLSSRSLSASVSDILAGTFVCFECEFERRPYDGLSCVVNVLCDTNICVFIFII